MRLTPVAETYVIYNFYAADYDREAFPKGRDAATRALAIDGELAEAHAALGLFKSQYEFDWDGAEESYWRAIELNPNYPTARQWYGEFLAFRLRTDESVAQLQKAIELDPTSLSTNTALALPYLHSRQFEKALAVTDKVLEMDAGFPLALHYKASLCSDWKGATRLLKLTRRPSRPRTAGVFQSRFSLSLRAGGAHSRSAESFSRSSATGERAARLAV